MTRTVETQFQVMEDAGRHLWLEVIRGEGSGLQVAVPKRHDDYSENLRENALALEPGEVIEATLKSENDKNTAWRFARIEDRNVESTTGDPRASGVADD